MKHLPLGSTIAYWERPSSDPITGEPGILRKEYRVRKVSDFSVAELVDAWGPAWRRYKPLAEYVLEDSYIRRGKDLEYLRFAEPWKPCSALNAYEDAFEYTDSHSVAICPVGKAIEAKQAELKRQQEEQAERKRIEVAAYECAERIRRESNAAYGRMADSKRFGKWAIEWLGWVERHSNSQDRHTVANDPEAFAAYTAVMDAVTVPAKAKAIKGFFKEAQRLHLE